MVPRGELGISDAGTLQPTSKELGHLPEPCSRHGQAREDPGGPGELSRRKSSEAGDSGAGHGKGELCKTVLPNKQSGHAVGSAADMGSRSKDTALLG